MMIYTFTLNRAHKVVERLKARAADILKEAQELVGPVRVRSQAEAGLKERAVDRAARAKVLLAEHMALLDTVGVLRRAVADANHAAAVDQLLCEQNECTQKVNAYKRVLEAADFEDASAWEEIPAEASEYAVYQLRVLDSETVDAFKSAMQAQQVRVHAVSDSVSDANRATIKVEMSAEHARIAGLTS